MDKRNPEPPGSGFLLYIRSLRKEPYGTAHSPLRDAPVLADAAAVWFSRRWGIPAESYRESMEQCLRRKAPVPQWYVVRDGGRLLAGAGVIANDFHDRKDLTPNLCALFVEPLAGPRDRRAPAGLHPAGPGRHGDPPALPGDGPHRLLRAVRLDVSDHGHRGRPSPGADVYRPHPAPASGARVPPDRISP